MSQSKIWFSSDFHFNHSNIIKHSNRPFSTKEEMDDAIIHNINSKVHKDHTLYFLGDFAWVRNSSDNNIERTSKYRNRIKCQNFIWTQGNHDPDWIPCQLGIRFNRDIFELKISKQEMYVLSHYPIHQWHRKRYGMIHLHGHSHGKSFGYDPWALDVGVDTNNFQPYNLDDVRDIMNARRLLRANEIIANDDPDDPSEH